MLIKHFGQKTGEVGLAAGITTRTIREDIFELAQVRDRVMQDFVQRVRIVERPVPRIHGEGGMLRFR